MPPNPPPAVESTPIAPLAPPLDAVALAGVSVAPPAVAPVPSYRDRGTGLTIFGVFQILLGLFAALMVPLAALGMLISRAAPGGAMRPKQAILGMATYAFAAAVLLALGIGSVQKKRWARALTIVTSWYWLFVGILGTILLTAILPVTMKSALAQAQRSSGAASPDLSTGVMAVVITFIIVFAAFFLVLVPIAFLVFYSREDVAETCRRRDPVERWTDRTPLPVLGASVVFLAGAFYLLLTGVSTPLFPFFGRYLTGGLGTLCFLVVAGIDAYLSVALFRLQPSGWWTAILTLAIRTISMAMTYARADLMQAYAKVGFSDAQLQILNSNPMFRSHVILWWSLASTVGIFAYLLWLKRYFKDSPAAHDGSFAPAAS